MTRPITIVAVAVALAAGGTAVAARPGNPFGGDPKDHEAELAKDLAANLDGVTPAEVQQALAKVREQRMAEHRAELARDLASRLDGVTVAQVEQALEQAHEQRTPGRPPEPGAFIATLAKELDKSEAEIRTALQASRRARLEARLDEAVKAGRLTEAQADSIRKRVERGRGFGPGPGFGRPGPGGPHPGPPPQ